MNSDLISREALLEEIAHGKNKPEKHDGAQEADWMMHCISTAPAVDARPVRHGRWLWTRLGYVCGEYEYKCSTCGETEWRTDCGRLKFCPFCGTKMDLEVTPNEKR